NSREDLLPNPEYDAIIAIFYCFYYDDESLDYSTNGIKEGYHVGVILNDNNKQLPEINLNGIEIKKVSSESMLIEEFVNIVINFDPDIISGYEIQNSSWGYFFQRAYLIYQKNLTKYLSRIESENKESSFDQEKDEWGYKKSSTIHIPGRIVLNIWRLMKAEYDLISYSVENLVSLILDKRIPHFTNETLIKWYESHEYYKIFELFNYYIIRVQYEVKLLEKSNIINKTCEFARIFGVLFFECISRGSQFKIESMLLRIIKPENFIVTSPSKQQVHDMRAIECIPLVMEPVSNFYTSPVLVLDFQSLYPSIMIAYNYCYSTCLGKLEKVDNEYHFGIGKYRVSHEVVKLLKDYVTISPNGNLYLKRNIRRGALSKMLSEILETRVLVKNTMKELNFIKELVKILDGKQLGLKYIANTTYGYTGASFSGRMPCIDISDDIVQSGREILEKSIRFIESQEKWNAKVIYGDTDSLFVLLPNASKETAFKYGKEICDEITARNLDPIKLKFEKVYHPCILITKKRYVGYKYEKLEDKPELEGKGIEMIRRDGCPLTQRLMKECLEILFDTRDISKLKVYLNNEWRNIIQEKVPLKEFIISKAVKLGKYGETHIPPSALIALEKMKHDPRSNPQYGERVPFIVIYKGPNSPLKDCIISPENLLSKIGYKIHSSYYIMKQIIPPLNRLFKIIGLDISQWYKQMPRIQTIDIYTNSQRVTNQYKGISTIDKYYLTNNCILCNSFSGNKGTYFCKKCLNNFNGSYSEIMQNLNNLENKYNYIQKICRKCTNVTLDLDIENCCKSMDCPILYFKQHLKTKLKVMYQISNDFLNNI
ncbi:DNA/RNA polymerase, partial [Neocallimastix californiae]